MESFSPRLTSRDASRPRPRRFHLALAFSALIFVGACEEDTPADPIRVASVEVTPRSSLARVGATQQLAAVAKDASGNPMSGAEITWKSAEPTVATVNASGLVTYVGAGSTAIIATARGTSGFATIVSDANVATVAMSLSTFNLPQPQTLQLIATPQDAKGVALFRPITWTSSVPTVATVSATGLVTSIGAGTTTITATSEGKTGTTSITVVPPAPVATVTLSSTSGYLPTTVGVPLTAALRDANNGVLTDRTVTWSSSNNAIATVSATGVVTGVASGTVTITATSEGKTGSGTFTVLNGLRSGTALTFTNANVNTSVFYAVYVPAGSTVLNVILRNGNGDPDLYVYRPGQALNTAAACASETGGATVSENCNLTTPAAGVWVVEVYAYEPHTGTTITATITPTPP